MRNNIKSLDTKKVPLKCKIPPLHRLNARGTLSCIVDKGAVMYVYIVG